MVYEACGNQDYEEVVKHSEESVQELQVCMYVCGHGCRHVRARLRVCVVWR
jgi:hypothetical protein